MAKPVLIPRNTADTIVRCVQANGGKVCSVQPSKNPDKNFIFSVWVTTADSRNVVLVVPAIPWEEFADYERQQILEEVTAKL